MAGFLAAHELMASRVQPLLRIPLLESAPPFLRLLKGLCEYGDMFMAIFFLLFCVNSFLALQAENARCHP